MLGSPSYDEFSPLDSFNSEFMHRIHAEFVIFTRVRARTVQTACICGPAVLGTPYRARCRAQPLPAIKCAFWAIAANNGAGARAWLHSPSRRGLARRRTLAGNDTGPVGRQRAR